MTNHHTSACSAARSATCSGAAILRCAHRHPFPAPPGMGAQKLAKNQKKHAAQNECGKGGGAGGQQSEQQNKVSLRRRWKDLLRTQGGVDQVAAAPEKWPLPARRAPPPLTVLPGQILPEPPRVGDNLGVVLDCGPRQRHHREGDRKSVV